MNKFSDSDLINDAIEIARLQAEVKVLREGLTNIWLHPYANGCHNDEDKSVRDIAEETLSFGEGGE